MKEHDAAGGLADTRAHRRDENPVADRYGLEVVAGQLKVAGRPRAERHGVRWLRRRSGRMRLAGGPLMALGLVFAPGTAAAASGWSFVAPMSTSRSGLAATSGPCQGNPSVSCLYAAGGDGSGGGGMSSVEMYTPSSNAWSAVASLNTARADLAAAAAPCEGNTSATCVYAVGGEVEGPNGVISLNVAEMYTPSSNGWSVVAPMSTGRLALGAAAGPCQGNVSANCLYAIGGKLGYPNFTTLSSVEMYSPGSNSWSAVASMNTARAELGATSGPCQANLTAMCIYATGGYSSVTLSAVEMYTPSGNPTVAWATHFLVQRHGQTIYFRWHVPDTALRGSRLLGFDVFAGKQRLNPLLIRVTGEEVPPRTYHLATRAIGHGPYTLAAVLANGEQVVVATAGGER